MMESDEDEEDEIEQTVGKFTHDSFFTSKIYLLAFSSQNNLQV